MYAIDQKMPESCGTCPFMTKKELFPNSALEIRSRFCIALDEFIPVTNSEIKNEKVKRRPRFCPLVKLPADEEVFYDQTQYEQSSYEDDVFTEDLVPGSYDPEEIEEEYGEYESRWGAEEPTDFAVQ